MPRSSLAVAGAVLCSVFLVLPLAQGAEPTITSYTQTYQVAGAGVVTVVCPSPDRDIGDWGDCVPMGEEHPGVPPEQQMWIGGAGIDIPVTSVPFHVRVDDLSGTPVAAAVCVDHDMDNLCGTADACWGNADPTAQCPRDPSDTMHVEQVIYFCGEADIPNTFNTDPMGMPFRHIDVWVRFVGNLQHVVFNDPNAPLCTGLPGPAGQGPLGVGTRGTATILAYE
ncbi:MAG: hypothetical protein ACRDGN_15420 [bacterium]